MKVGISVALIFVLGGGGLASARAEDGCSAVLKFGIWNTRDTSDAVADSQQVANWACNASSETAGGSFSYGPLHLDMSKGGAANSCSSSNSGYILLHQHKDTIKSVSKDLVKAWEDCMSGFGSHASVLFYSDMHQFTIILQSRGFTSNQGKAIITSVEKDFRCSNMSRDELESGIEYNNGISISCTRPDITKAIAIDVNYPDGPPGEALYIAAIAPPVPTSPAEAKVVSVQAPPDSSDGNSWPVSEKWWKASFPIVNPLQVGIGHIIEPLGFKDVIGSRFAMHDHHYVAPQVPDPNRACVTYTFDKPTEISEVKIIQHANGITKIEGFIGETADMLKCDAAGSLISMGFAWSNVNGDADGSGKF